MRLRTRMRRAWRELTGQRNAFAAAEVNRLLLDWVFASLRSADDEVRGDLQRLRSRGRDLARNNGYIAGYLGLLAQNVIGPFGFKMQAQVRDDAGNLVTDVNRRIETAWREWSTGKVTVDGRMSLPWLERLLLQTARREGEVFVRLWDGFDLNPHRFALQPIDPDLIDHNYNAERGPNGNEIRMGIEIDRLGRPLGYWVSTSPQGASTLRPREQYFVPGSQMLHLYDPHRINATRGVCAFHPVMQRIKLFDGYEEAELVAARTAAAKMGFLRDEEDEGGEGEGNEEIKAGEMEAAPGVIEDIGKKNFVPWDPQHPTTAYPFYTKTVLRAIARGLGVSYNSLANDLESVNYSSMKSGLTGERDGYRVAQQWWLEVFRVPVYAGWLPNALLSGALRLPSVDPRRYGTVRWSARGWPSLEPLKEAQAADMRLKNGTTSRTALLAEEGIDFEDVLEELAEEKRLAAAMGISIEGDSAKTPPEKDKPAPEDEEPDDEPESDEDEPEEN